MDVYNPQDWISKGKDAASSHASDVSAAAERAQASGAQPSQMPSSGSNSAPSPSASSSASQDGKVPWWAWLLGSVMVVGSGYATYRLTRKRA